MKLVLGTVAAVSLAAATVGLAANAGAAPAGPPSVESTVNQLRAQGYQVVVNRVGTGTENCTVRAIRPGQTFSRTDSGAPGAGTDLVTTITNKSVYVDVAC